MTNAINAEARLAYVAEVVPGTTPANPAFKVLRSTGESLKVERNLLFSSELDGRRGQKNFARGTSQGSGSIDFEVTDGTLEDLLESVMRATWTADVLTDANLVKSFTIEATYENGATDTYKRLAGAEVSTFALNVRAGEIVTGSFGIMARTADFAQAGIAGAAYTAGNAEPIETAGAVDAVAMAGLTLGCVQSITLNVNNNLAARVCVGDQAVHEFAPGVFEVSGSISALLDSGQYSILRAYADGTSTSLTFEVGTTAGKKLRFELPLVVLEDLDGPAAESKEGDVIVTLNFRALQATSIANSVLRITRNV